MNCERDCECCDRMTTCDMAAADAYREANPRVLGEYTTHLTLEARVEVLEGVIRQLAGIDGTNPTLHERVTAIEGILSEIAGVILLDAEGRP